MHGGRNLLKGSSGALFSGAVAVIAVVGLVAVLPGAGPGRARTSVIETGSHFGPTPTPTAQCEVFHAKVTGPAPAVVGDPLGITMTVSAVCRGERFPVHIVLVIEGSSAMRGTLGRQVQEGATGLVRSLQLDLYPSTFVGVVGFDDEARRLSGLTNSEARVRAAINRVGDEGGARIDQGLDAAGKIMQGAPEHDRATQVAVLFSHGPVDEACEEAFGASRRLKGQGILVIAVCAGGDCDARCMRQIASSPRYYFELENAFGTWGVFQQIRDRIININLKRLTVTDYLADGMDYVPDSASPKPVATDPAGRWFRWEDVYIPKDGVTYSLKVRPSRAGRWPTNAKAEGDVVTNKGTLIPWRFDVPVVDVVEPSPTPTATSTPFPSLAAMTATPPHLEAVPIDRAVRLPWAGR
jgi:hypothetical protein